MTWQFPLNKFLFALRQGTCVAMQTKRMETDSLCGVMTKLNHVQKSADDLAIPTKQVFCILLEEQSFCFLKALQNIHLGQLRTTFSSPFCVAGVGRSIIILVLNA